MVGATGALVVCSLALTVVAGPLLGYTTHAAEDALDRDHYISSVLPGGSQ
jgi:multicomponent Na+:H+ antiporter subunit D